MSSKVPGAVALCRVSTSKQRLYGNSLEAQEVRITKAAELLGADLHDSRIWRLDVSSKKGKNLKRKDILQIFDTCKKDKQIRFFIIDEPDRFMRSIDEYYWWKVEFKKINVQLPEGLLDVYISNSSSDDEDE